MAMKWSNHSPTQLVDRQVVLAHQLASPNGVTGRKVAHISRRKVPPYVHGHLRIPHFSSRAVVMASSFSSHSSPSAEAEALSAITIFTSDGSPVQFRQLWDQRAGLAVVAFLRHFGCPMCWEFAATLRDVKPKLDAADVKLVVIGVGTPDKARILADRLPFPREVLYADPERKAYDVLGLYYGLGRTFFNPASAKVLGRLDNIRKAIKEYTLEATPEDRSSVLQQGGLYIFRGTQLLYSRKDEGTGDHTSLDDVLNICCSTAVA